MKTGINILPSFRIDKDKWDSCVRKNANGLIYSAAAYLDTMSANWHGIVVDDYAAVIALPWKNKFGIRYCYTPAFIQQLGLIGNVGPNEYAEILNAVHRFIPFADIHFNFSNSLIQQYVSVAARTNLILDLSAGYDQLHAKYSSDLKMNIKKASNGSLIYYESNIEQGIAFYISHYQERMPHILRSDYEHFSELCYSLQKNNNCFVRAARNQTGDILAIAVFLFDGKRIYNMMNTTMQKGRAVEANHFLLDKAIQEFAGQPLLFDFEGSDLPGVREFYEKFGALNQPYFHYHYNGLRWPLRLLKR